MQWTSNIQHPIYAYTLTAHGRALQTMTFNYQKNTWTALCESESGAFVIDREGFFKNKLVLKENDVTIGRLYAKNWYSQNGIADIKGEKLLYRIVNNPLAEIQFLHHAHLLIACGLKLHNHRMEPAITTATHFDKHPFASYLAALSWYLLLPMMQEDTTLMI